MGKDREQTIEVSGADLSEVTGVEFGHSGRFVIHFGGKDDPYITLEGKRVGGISLEHLAAFDTEGGMP